LPVHADLLGLRNRSVGNAWCTMRQLAGRAAHIALSPLVSGGSRPSSGHCLLASVPELKRYADFTLPNISWQAPLHLRGFAPFRLVKALWISDVPSSG